MNILITNYSEVTSPGGVHKAIREIAENLSNSGHRVTILQANPLSLPENEMRDGYRILRVNLPHAKFFYDFDWRIFFFLKNYLTELNPDIIHVHGYHSLFSIEIIFIIKKLLHNPVNILFSPHFAINSHNTIAGKYMWKSYNYLNKYIFKLVDKVICASEYEYNEIKDTFNISLNKCILIPHGVDEMRLNTQIVKGIKNGRISLLSAGYLLEIKGFHHILFAVYELIYTLNKKVTFTIVGEGNFKSKLIELSNKLSIEDSIKWLPFLETSELYKEYRKTDMFLLLSKSENYGIVVAEALAQGTPCIVANTTALVEFTKEPGCFGVTYPPNPSEVAELILKIYETDIKVGPFSKKIRTWEDVAKEYGMLYSKLLDT